MRLVPRCVSGAYRQWERARRLGVPGLYDIPALLMGPAARFCGRPASPLSPARGMDLPPAD